MPGPQTSGTTTTVAPGTRGTTPPGRCAGRTTPCSTAPGEPAIAHTVAPFLATAHQRWLADGSGNPWRRRPASLLLGDVSWITALAEEPTDELPQLLSAAFGRLFEAAAAHGGDVLELAGDTVLVAFEGPGHERRATQSAAALPAALRGLPGYQPSAPAAMSLGIATGELDLFLVGDDHRELIAAGPLVSTAVRLERAAGDGEVIADGPTAAAVNDGRWGGLDRGGHTLLSPPPASTVGLGLGSDGVHDLPVTALLTGIPVGLRGQVGAGSAAQHRQVAVASVQVMGVDDLLLESGHAAVADALDAVVRTAQAACATHRTTFLSTAVDDGAVTMLLATGTGTPDAGADDVGRLLLAARKVAATACALRVRVGVHHGGAIAVDVGNERRRVHTVLGEAVHVAARAMTRSDRGAVVATDRTLVASRTRFGARPVPPLEVEGRTEPVRVSTVGRPLGQDPQATTGTELLGREAERGVLLAALADARAGNPRVVVVLGEAGIGKSRLVAEVLAAAPDLPHLRVAGDANAVGSPYAAVRASLRSLLGLDGDVAEAAVVSALLDVVGSAGEQWLPLLAPAFGVALPETSVTARLEARFRRARSHALVTELLRRLLAEHTLVVVEDAHLLDDASTGLLHHVLGAFAKAPWMVLLSRRDQPGGLELQPSDDVTHVELGPLEPQAAAALLHEGSDDRLPRRELDALIACGRGNPLFLQQLRALVASGAAVDDLPATIEAAIAARIDRLDRPRRRQLRAASALGERFPMRLLAGIQVDADSDQGRSLRGILARDEPGWLRFPHALVRDSAYEGLSDRSRRDLHGRIGALIEDEATAPPGRAELLSYHYTEGRRWASAWRWSVLAAERSATIGAWSEAAGFLRRAVRATGQLEVDDAELSCVYERLAEAEELAGRLDDATDALTRARRLTADPVRTAQLLHRHGQVSERAGNHVAALRWFGRGLQQLADGPPTGAGERVRIDLVIAQASTKVRQGRRRQAVSLLEAAVVDAEAAGYQRALAKARRALSTLAAHDAG